MVRLRTPIPSHSSKSAHWRLLLLIVPLALVMLMMAQLRDPDTADRINRAFATDEEEEPAAEAPAPAPARRLFPGVRREMLASIEDNTYFRNAEKVAWFHFVELLQQTPEEQLDAVHGIDADYTQLVDQPDFYRGKLVTVNGRVRQVTQQTPAANDLGLESYYRVVVQPADAVEWPIFVYCLDLPNGLSAGDEGMGTMTATGLFFKSLSYSSPDGMGTAPVILARSIGYHRAAPDDSSRRVIRVPEDTNSSTASESNAAHTSDQSAAEPPARSTAFRDILNLAGWDAERLAAFDDGRALSDEQRVEALELLRRMRSFEAAILHEWSDDALAPNEALTNSADYRGQLVRLAGRVTNATRRVPSDEVAERLEMPEYFECELVPYGKGLKPMSILALRVPEAWLGVSVLNEPATAIALLLKRTNDETPRAIWLAKEVAWHPTTVDEPRVSLGKSVLGRLGMDVGLLDLVDSRGRIRPQERETFYQMLAAVGRMNAAEPVRLAEENLPAVRQAWQRELAKAADDSRRALAREVVQRAGEGRYSVAPLFNDPQAQIGQLVVIDGVARRVVRVEVGERPSGGGPSDVAKRFGFDHYYQMEVFTDDSQNYPLVFCVRELPAGFPTGGSIHVPVRVAGFFLKDWLYRTRRSEATDEGEGQQYAPLLVGRAPLVLEVEQREGIVPFVLGGLFLAAMAGVWAAAAWYAREDRRFRASVPAARISLPPGQSLNELNLAASDEPMKE